MIYNLLTININNNEVIKISTPRTRRQNRISAPQQQKQSNPLARKISSIIATSVTLCIISGIANKAYPDMLPSHLILKIIGLTFIVLIFTIVRFVIKQYKSLKNTYQNLEQSMQQSMMYGSQQIDYVEYPQYNQQIYPQQGYQQGYRQDYQQGYLPQYNQAYNQQPRRRKKGLIFNLVLTFAILGILAFACLQLFIMMNSVINKPTNTYIYECVESKVTKANSYQYEETDEDTGSVSTVTAYGFEAVYSYGGKEYTITSSTQRKKISEGDTVYIYLNPDSPETDRLTSFELSNQLITYFAFAVVIEFMLLLLLPLKLAIKYGRYSSSR